MKIDIQALGAGVLSLERELALQGQAPVVGIIVGRATAMAIKASPDQHMLTRDPRLETSDRNYAGSIVGVPFYMATLR